MCVNEVFQVDFCIYDPNTAPLVGLVGLQLLFGVVYMDWLLFFDDVEDGGLYLWLWYVIYVEVWDGWLFGWGILFMEFFDGEWFGEGVGCKFEQFFVCCGYVMICIDFNLLQLVLFLVYGVCGFEFVCLLLWFENFEFLIYLDWGDFMQVFVNVVMGYGEGFVYLIVFNVEGFLSWFVIFVFGVVYVEFDLVGGFRVMIGDILVFEVFYIWYQIFVGWVLGVGLFEWVYWYVIGFEIFDVYVVDFVCYGVWVVLWYLVNFNLM